MQHKMNIIRDNEMGGLMMIPLFTQWRIERCNVKDCHEKPTTLITGVIEAKIALCEKHYNESKAAGKLAYTLEWGELSKV
jgi:hypothetical protein